MLLDNQLLKSISESWSIPDVLDAKNIRGSYNPMQFALRLAPNIHKELQSIESGIVNASQLSFHTIQAFSTYLHETIHWWQHIGSNLGLILSFIYPVQTHTNYRDLKYLIKHIGPIKSILNYNKINAKPVCKETETNKRVNCVLNNWYDINNCNMLILDPQKARTFVENPYFESVGHSYTVTWTQILNLLSDSFDKKYDFLPNPKNWENSLLTLRKKKTEGFYHGSPIRLAPFGARQIFEGQARFSQLQYLYIAFNGKVNWDDFKIHGMLNGIYAEAFNLYLKLIGAKWPNSPLSPIVGLFLLLCEITINPTDGFPFDIIHFPSFIYSVDPGTRFVLLCQVIQTKYPHITSAIVGYTKNEYLEICATLCKSIVCKTPADSALKVTDWACSYNGCKKLLLEDDLFNFSSVNMPVRLFFARYLHFQQDKFKYPEYFCWPGFWLSGGHKTDISTKHAIQLFEKHSALFVDGIDGNIYPRTFIDKKEENIQNTFDAFYGWNASYELTKQWIIENGPFQYNFSWLTTRFSYSEIVKWADNTFEQVYGVSPKSFHIL